MKQFNPQISHKVKSEQIHERMSAAINSGSTSFAARTRLSASYRAIHPQ